MWIRPGNVLCDSEAHHRLLVSTVHHRSMAFGVDNTAGSGGQVPPQVVVVLPQAGPFLTTAPREGFQPSSAKCAARLADSHPLPMLSLYKALLEVAGEKLVVGSQLSGRFPAPPSPLLWVGVPSALRRGLPAGTARASGSVCSPGGGWAGRGRSTHRAHRYSRG